MQLLSCCHPEHCFKFCSLQQSSSWEWWRKFSFDSTFEFALQGQLARLIIKKEQSLAEMGLFSASLHYFLISSWEKHLAVDLCTGKTFSSWQQDFSVTGHSKFLQLHWWIFQVFDIEIVSSIWYRDITGTYQGYT